MYTHPDQILRRGPSLDPSTNFNDFGPEVPSAVDYRRTTSLGYSSGPAAGNITCQVSCIAVHPAVQIQCSIQ